MSQPEGYHLESDSGLEQMQCSGMSKGMWRNPPGSDRWAGLRCGANGTCETKLNADPRQRSAVPIAEEWLIRPELMVANPLGNEAPRLGPEGDLSLLASFALETHHGTVGISYVESRDLGYSGTGVVHQREEHAITSVTPGRVVASGKDRGDFLSSHEADERFAAALERNREQALSLCHVVGTSYGEDEMCEASDRGQTGVPGANGIVTHGLEMVEKRQDGIRIERCERELVSVATVVIAEKSEQQTKGVAISGDGLRAHVAMRHQMFREVPLNEGRERDRVHACRGKRC